MIAKAIIFYMLVQLDFSDVVQGADCTRYVKQPGSVLL